jgi:hypothetical protein
MIQFCVPASSFPALFEQHNGHFIRLDLLYLSTKVLKILITCFTRISIIKLIRHIVAVCREWPQKKANNQNQNAK